MKKLFVICLAVVLAATLSVSAFAFGSGFVTSPSQKPAPELVLGDSQSDDCTAELIITAYGDRDTLPADARQALEKAYAMILGAEHVAELNALVQDIAAEKNVSLDNIAVSDLFDIRSTDCDDHELHGHFDVTLKADTLKNFVCLLHYHNGVWHVVDSAEVTQNGEHLEFDVEEFSPFAIVVATEDIEPESDYTAVIAAAVAAVAVIAIAVVVFIKLKSKKKNA